MNERLFLTPWGNRRYPAAFIEEHCAICRALELPDATPPVDAFKALAAAPPALRERAEADAAACAVRLPQMLAWCPDDYVPGQPCAFDKLRSGSAHDHYALFGGRGGAKSYDAADAIIELASTRKERVAGAREFMKRIKESSKEILDDRARESEYAADWEITEYELRNKRTGSEIIFIGLNGLNAESVAKSLEGVTMLWADEAQFLSQNSLDAILPTIRKAGSRCVWTWNPGKEPSPVDALFRGENPPERSLVQCRLVEDNAHLYRTRLAAEMRSSFLRDTSDKYRHIWRGAHLEITDATVFPNVEQGYLDWPALLCGGAKAVSLHGMDFGYGGEDPSAAVEVHLIPAESRPDGGQRPILYVAKEAVERSVPNHELGRLARAVGARQILCDSGAPLMIDALQASGVAAYPAKKGAGSILAGITKMQSCDIIVSPHCPHAFEELKALRWSVDPRTGKVRRPLTLVGSDHAVDAARYALSETELAAFTDGVIYLED